MFCFGIIQSVLTYVHLVRMRGLGMLVFLENFEIVQYAQYKFLKLHNTFYIKVVVGIFYYFTFFLVPGN